MKMRLAFISVFCLFLTGVTGMASDGGRYQLLVGNTAADNVVAYSQNSGKYLGEFISADSGLLDSPDAIVVGPDSMLYVSTGTSLANSAILRFDWDGNYLGVFASGGGMLRPYGYAWGPDGMLYVASFLSDQILRYNGVTGAFVDVFAQGDALPDGLNGPDDIAFGPDGMLYITTQGSVAVNGSPTFPGLPSQVLRYDISTGAGEVFVDQPPASPEGFGFVSFLGIKFGPDSDNGDCDVWTSDFANDIRRFDLDGNLVQVISTNYTGTLPSNNFVGNLAFGKNNDLFSVAFNLVDPALPGAILRWDSDGNPKPKAGNGGAIFAPENNNLVRCIGILAVDTVMQQ